MTRSVCWSANGRFVVFARDRAGAEFPFGPALGLGQDGLVGYIEKVLCSLYFEIDQTTGDSWILWRMRVPGGVRCQKQARGPTKIRRAYLLAHQRLLLRGTLLRINDGNGYGQSKNREGSEEAHGGFGGGDDVGKQRRAREVSPSLFIFEYLHGQWHTMHICTAFFSPSPHYFF